MVLPPLDSLDTRCLSIRGLALSTSAFANISDVLLSLVALSVAPSLLGTFSLRLAALFRGFVCCVPCEFVS